MRLYSLGGLDWKDTQLFYHAMAHLGLEGVIICRPNDPYFCVGFHQDVQQELDLMFLNAIGVPYFRRETGGGTVRLDKGQVFYQIIVKKDTKECPPNPERFYERYLQPAVEALDALGLGAIVAEPNDILVNGKKVSGNGGADVGECKVLVGDILVDFDPAKMCRGLKTPTGAFRAACVRRMKADVTTVRAERPGATVEKVERALRKAYLKVCGDGESTCLPAEVLAKARELEGKYLAKDWLLFPGPRRPWRRVKVREGVHVAAMPIGDGEELFGQLQIETLGGALDRVELVPISSSTKTDGPASNMTAMWKALVVREGRPRKDLARLLMEMDIPKERLDAVMADILERATRPGS
jgi:lipoate-protein ligase A